MANIVNSYIDKYKGVDENRLSVYEILQKIGTTEYQEGANKKYEAVGIDYVLIGENKFKNYGQYRFIWEKTLLTEPKRSGNGSMGNITDIGTFLTPHLIMDFSIMSIDEYRAIMRLHYGANEFTVKCYDVINNEQIKVKMYFATEEMAKLYTISQNRLLPNGGWEEWVDIVGVSEYSVELIGTNNDLDTVTVTYVYNAVSTTPMPNEVLSNIYRGEEILIGERSKFPDNPPSNKVFKHWVDDFGLIYTNKKAWTVNSNLTLYAVWQ